MPRSHRSRSPEPLSYAQRVARRWREGVLAANLSIAGYLAQLPHIEEAIFGRGMLTTVGVGLGVGLTWMMLRGALASPYDFGHARRDDARAARRRAPSQRPTASQPSGRILTIAPETHGPRASRVPPAPAAHASERPAPPAQSGATMAGYPTSPPPTAHAQSGATMAGQPPAPWQHAHAETGTTMEGFPAALASSAPSQPSPAAHASELPAARSSAPAFTPHANQTGATLHGWTPPPPELAAAQPAHGAATARASSPPAAYFGARADAFGQARAASLADTRPDAFAAAHDPDASSRPSGPPTMRMTALQEAELAASPDASRPQPAPSDRPSQPSPRLSWPPEVELTTPARSARTSEPSLPPPKVPMAALSRAVPTPPPANDGDAASYIDTFGEPALTLGVNSSLPPEQRQQAHALARRLTARVDVVHAEASPSAARLEPELLDQLEELRAELLTMSPTACFVIGISSDAEHAATKSGLALVLAQQLARSGSRRVLLIEANATRPMLDRALGLHVPLAAGFSQQMHRRMTAVSPNWTVLRLGPTLDVLAEGRFRTPGMLYGSVFAVALHELRDHYDVIVADGPVVETSEAAAAFAQVVDGIGYLTSGLPSIRVHRERALARFHDKALFKVMTAP